MYKLKNVALRFFINNIFSIFIIFNTVLTIPFKEAKAAAGAAASGPSLPSSLQRYIASLAASLAYEDDPFRALNEDPRYRLLLIEGYRTIVTPAALGIEEQPTARTYSEKTEIGDSTSLAGFFAKLATQWAGLEGLLQSKEGREVSLNAICLVNDDKTKPVIVSYRGTADLADVFADVGIVAVQLDKDVVEVSPLMAISKAVGARNAGTYLTALTTPGDTTHPELAVFARNFGAMLGELVQKAEDHHLSASKKAKKTRSEAEGAARARSTGHAATTVLSAKDVDKIRVTTLREQGPMPDEEILETISKYTSIIEEELRTEGIESPRMGWMNFILGVLNRYITVENARDYLRFLLDSFSAMFVDRMYEVLRFRHLVSQAFPDRPMIITGHSLGGGFATAVARLDPRPSTETIAFDAPGMKGVLSALRKKGKKDPLRRLNVTTLEELYGDKRLPAAVLDSLSATESDVGPITIYALGLRGVRSNAVEALEGATDEAGLQFDAVTAVQRYAEQLDKKRVVKGFIQLVIIPTEHVDPIAQRVSLHLLDPLVRALAYGHGVVAAGAGGAPTLRSSVLTDPAYFNASHSVAEILYSVSDPELSRIWERIQTEALNPAESREALKVAYRDLAEPVIAAAGDEAAAAASSASSGSAAGASDVVKLLLQSRPWEELGSSAEAASSGKGAASASSRSRSDSAPVLELRPVYSSSAQNKRPIFGTVSPIAAVPPHTSSEAPAFWQIANVILTTDGFKEQVAAEIKEINEQSIVPWEGICNNLFLSRSYIAGALGGYGKWNNALEGDIKTVGVPEFDLRQLDEALTISAETIPDAAERETLTRFIDGLKALREKGYTIKFTRQIAGLRYGISISLEGAPEGPVFSFPTKDGEIKLYKVGEFLHIDYPGIGKTSIKLAT